MKDFLPNINWAFLLQIFILILTWQFFTYLYASFKRFEKYSKQDKKTVLNETSNFIERQLVNETVFYKIISCSVGLLILMGFFAFICSIAMGYNAILKLPGLQNFWSSLFFYIAVLSFAFLLLHWAIDNLKDSKSLTDYEKLKKYLKTRETLNITLQFRFAKLQRAFLPKANLSYADLTGADLSCADLRAANLTETKLSNADLGAADLREAKLNRANLENANLSLAFLNRAILMNANLQNADLSEANLAEADLTSADLRNAKLRKTDLRGANLTGANVIGADLRNSDLTDVIGLNEIMN